MPLLVYFDRDSDEFPEMISFRNQFLSNRNLQLLRLEPEFKVGLGHLKHERGIRAVFLGQRKTDPHVPTTPFALTTQGWVSCSFPIPTYI